MIEVTTFTVDKWRLEKLLESINRGKIQVPDFQRPWIWDDGHIKSLLASVSRSYPIGTILMLETGNKDLTFATRMLEGVSIEKIENDGPDKLILDGQQRLTALYQSLYSELPANPKESMHPKSKKRVKRWYYMDINGALVPGEDNIEDSIKSFSEEVAEIDGFRKMLFPLNRVFNFSQWRDKYYRYWNYDDTKCDEVRAFERDIVMKCFYSYEVPYVTLLKDTPLEAICPIFERINSTGVNLDVFDLLIAIYAAKKFNLRKDWENRLDSMSQKYNVLKDLKGTDFLKTITLLSTYKGTSTARLN